MKTKRIAAALLAATLLGGGAIACNGKPSCPAGQVAEYDDDGWECEPDENGDGEDDEGSDGGSVWKVPKKKTPKPYKKPLR